LNRAEYLPAGMEAQWMEVAEEYCWAMTQTVGQSPSGSIALGFGFQQDCDACRLHLP
jgi:hypothetical protein